MRMESSPKTWILVALQMGISRDERSGEEALEAGDLGRSGGGVDNGLDHEPGAQDGGRAEGEDGGALAALGLVLGGGGAPSGLELVDVVLKDAAGDGDDAPQVASLGTGARLDVAEMGGVVGLGAKAE